jgi:hypothetical protein
MPNDTGGPAWDAFTAARGETRERLVAYYAKVMGPDSASGELFADNQLDRLLNAHATWIAEKIREYADSIDTYLSASDAADLIDPEVKP